MSIPKNEVDIYGWTSGLFKMYDCVCMQVQIESGKMLPFPL